MPTVVDNSSVPELIPWPAGRSQSVSVFSSPGTSSALLGYQRHAVPGSSHILLSRYVCLPRCGDLANRRSEHLQRHCRCAAARLTLLRSTGRR